jgi:hypothetical protein
MVRVLGGLWRLFGRQNFKNMKISDDRGKISDPAGKRDISEISDPTGRYFFPCDVALLWEDPRPAQLLTLSVERGLDEAEVADLVLRASHLSSESAWLGLASGFGRMAARHGMGSSGSIFHLGGVGSSVGRAACATLRCTRATGMAMVDGRRRTETTRTQSQQKRRQVMSRSWFVEMEQRGDGGMRFFF